MEEKGKVKKILQIVSCLELGGTEAFIMNNYRVLNRSEYQFDFAVFCEKDYPYSDEINQLGGHIYFVGTPSFYNIHKFIKHFKVVVAEGGPYVASTKCKCLLAFNKRSYNKSDVFRSLAGQMMLYPF